MDERQRGHAGRASASERDGDGVRGRSPREMMAADQPADLRSVIQSAYARTGDQIAALERAVAGIMEGAELTATDDEHDPEGATIAYERAQATALLRQARLDLGQLARARERVEAGERIECERCGAEIALERLLALPSTGRCIGCASRIG